MASPSVNTELRTAGPSGAYTVTATPSFGRGIRRLTRFERAVPGLLALAAFAVYARHAWTRYTTFRSAGYDLGIFDQAVRHYAHFHAPMDSIKGEHVNLLGDHFSPLVALLAPLYWIWADPRMLGFALAALLAVSVVPVHSFTRRRLGPWCALVIALGYLLWWPLQNLVNFDFHEVAFAIPLLAWFIDALDRGRYRTALLLGVALLGVREDMGAVLAMAGLVLALRRHYRWAAVLSGLGVAAFVLMIDVIVPAFAATGSWAYWDYPALGPNAAAAARFALHHPGSTLHLLVSNETKRRTLGLLLFGPTVFALVSPYVLLAVPILAERLLSARETLWETQFHYDSALAPILVLAAVDSLARLAKQPWFAEHRAWARSLPLVICALLPLVAVAGTIVDPALYPLHSAFDGQDGHKNPHVRDQVAAVAQLPAGVCVESDDRLIPHLVARDTVTTPTHSGQLATWIVLDLSVSNTGGGTSPSPQVAYAADRAAGFRVVFNRGSLVVLHKDAPVAASCAHIN